MKVKYNGKEGLYFHNINFYPGDVKEVANDLEFPENVCEVVKEEGAPKSSAKKKAATSE